MEARFFRRWGGLGAGLGEGRGGGGKRKEGGEKDDCGRWVGVGAP